MKKRIILLMAICFLLLGCNSYSSSIIASSLNGGSIIDSYSSYQTTSSVTNSSYNMSTSVNHYSVIVNNGTGTNYNVLEGEYITVVAYEPEEGKRFAYWNDHNNNIVSYDKTYTFVVTCNIVLTAIYENDEYTVVVHGGTGGGIYQKGSQATVIANLDDEDEFIAWTDENDNVISTLNPYIFTVEKNIELFSKIKVNTSLDSLKGLIKAITNNSSVQKNTASINYSFIDDKYSSSYSTSSLAEDITMYKNALYIEGKELVYSSYQNYKGIIKYENNCLKQVKEYEEVSLSSSAVCFEVVDEIKDSSSQVNLDYVNNLIDSYNGIKTLISLLNSDEISIVDSYVVSENNDYMHIDLLAHSLTSTLYNQVYLSLNIDSTYYIKDFSIMKKIFVIANSCDENNNLIENATPRYNGYCNETYSFVKSNEERKESELCDITPYFISDYKFKGRYYDHNVQRYFSEEFPYISLGAEITISYIEMIESSISPRTYLETTDLNFVSVSDETILQIGLGSDSNPYKLTAISLGEVTITMESSTGKRQYLSLTVRDDLPPVSFKIDCQDVVNINEQIELNIKDISPINASKEVVFSVDNNDLAEIIFTDGKYYLKGLKSGNVTLLAHSIEDPLITASKIIFISKGDLSNEELEMSIKGKWLGGDMDESKAFVFTFSDNNDFTSVDNYRRGAKINCVGKYELTNNLDSTVSHDDKDASNTSDYYVITINNIVLGTGDKDTMYLKIHFAVKKDCSKMFVHFGTNSSQTLIFELTKVG